MRNLFFLLFVVSQAHAAVGRVSTSNTTYLYPAIALAVGFALGYWRRQVFSTRDFQNQGEALLSGTLRKHFNTTDYHLLNHITLKHGDGTTQIDHILISRFGVFVIETKNYKGWIFGDAKHETWTQTTFNSKFKFQNPIHQNYRHVLAVRALLDFVPPDLIHSVVAFVGDAEFKTDMPAGVFKRPQLVEHLRSYTEDVLSLNRVQFCVGRLETARLIISEKTDLEHVQDLQRRYGQAP